MSWLRNKVRQWIGIDEDEHRRGEIAAWMNAELQKIYSSQSNLADKLEYLDQAQPSFKKCEIYVSQHEIRLEKEIEARRSGQCEMTDKMNSLHEFIVRCAKFSDNFVKRYNKDKRRRRNHGKTAKRIKGK